MLKKITKNKINIIILSLITCLALMSCSEVQNETFNNTVSEFVPEEHHKVPRDVIVRLEKDMVTITWEPPAIKEDNVLGYAIYRKESKGNHEWTLLSNENIQSLSVEKIENKEKKYLLIDIPPKKNIPYDYAVTTLFKTEKQSNKSASAQGAIYDNEAPYIPTHVQSHITTDDIILSWKAPNEKDLGGYNVYFKAEKLNQLTYVKVNQKLISADSVSYTHRAVDKNITYTYVVTALDINNNESIYSQSTSAIIDSSGPELTLTKKPTQFSNQSSPEFMIDTNEKVSACIYILNNGNKRSCTINKALILSELKEGAYTITFYISDESNNEKELSYRWYVDYKAPQINFTETPDEHTSANSARFTVEVDDPFATIYFSLDSSDFTKATLPILLDDLSDGYHKLMVKVQDRSQNENTISYKWKVDTTPPSLTYTVTEPSILSKRYFSEFDLNYFEENAILSYRHNSHIEIPLESKSLTLHSFEGPNTVTFKMADSLGNDYDTSYSWSLNTLSFSLGNTPGNDDNTFVQPNTMLEDKDGNIFVVDSVRHRVQKFNKNRQHVFTLGTTDKAGSSIFDTESINDYLWNPNAIATDSNGNIYISDTLYHRIQVFNKNGQYVRTIGKSSSPNNLKYTFTNYETAYKTDSKKNDFKTVVFQNNPEQFNTPMGLAIDEDRDRLYVADLANKQVKIHALKSGNFGAVIRHGNDNTPLSSPVAISIAKNGDIYIVDRGRHAVFIFDKDGNYKGNLGSIDDPGESLSQFNSPSGISINSKGDIAISDTSNHRVIVFDSNKNFKYMVGQTRTIGKRSFLLNSPHGVHLNDNGELFIADKGNNRIMVYQR